MLDSIEFSADIAPIVDHVALVHSQSARADRLEQLRSQQTRCWAATEQYAEQLNRLYEEIARSGHEADWLAQAAEIVDQRERADREKLRPGIEALKQRLAAPQDLHDAEARRVIEESIAVGEAWLTLPAALHKKLLQLATERRAAAGKIRRAHPVDGEIDYARLSREHLARYPKIRAALAK